MTDHKPCDLCQTTHNLAGDSADTLASEILEAHCTCYAKVWPGHTAANASHAVARKIREALGVRVFDRAALAKTQGRLDAALAQVARLREALQAAVDCGMVPVSSAKDGGAVRYSRHVQVADQIRATLAETADTPAPAPADDGWTAWEGGECPVATGTLVEARLADGYVCMSTPADKLQWMRGDPFAIPIVAYRIVGARDG